MADDRRHALGGNVYPGDVDRSPLCVGMLFTFVQARPPLDESAVPSLPAGRSADGGGLEILGTGWHLPDIGDQRPCRCGVFGSIIGIMAFAYLASRIRCIATAWCAYRPEERAYQVVDQIEPPTEEDE